MAFATPDPPVHTLIVLNPGSGSGGEPEAVAPVWNAAAGRRGWSIVEPADAAEAQRAIVQAVEAGCERVVAAGGDGTIHSVLQILAGLADPPVLGVLPVGTGNDLARTLALPFDAARAIDVLDMGNVRSLDLLRVQAGPRVRHCINVATGGVSKAVAEALTSEDKSRLGALSYIKGAAGEMRGYTPYALRIILEGGAGELRVDDVLAVAVANGRFCAGGMAIAPTADPEDGQLDLVLIRTGPPLAMAGLASRLATGRMLESEMVEHRRTTRLVIDSRPSMAFNLDGEPFEDDREDDRRGRVEFEVLPGRLSVLVGPSYAPGATDLGA